jgi:hypothetical protein
VLVLQRKREKAERVKHLSQSIRERNQASVESAPERPAASSAAPEQGAAPISKRDRMQQYAHSVQNAATHNWLPSPKRHR